MPPNPLDAFVGRRAPSEVKVRPMPKFTEYLKLHGLSKGAAAYDRDMETWRQDLQRGMPTDATITEQVTTIVQTVINNVQQGGGQSQGGGSPPPFDTSALEAQIQAMSDALAAHIAANIVHGTISPVVGQTDEQSLERKTIGESEWRNARFKHALQVNEILPGESYLIPTGFNTVVAGPFDIQVGGELVVEGNFGCV